MKLSEAIRKGLVTSLFNIMTNNTITPMKAYKLTDANGQTRNNTQWGPNVTHEVSGTGELCSKGWLHFYDCPLLAVILNPIHGQFDPSTMKLWEAEAEGTIKEDNGLKFGCQKLTTIRKVQLPNITTEHRIKFAIYCSLEVYNETNFVQWANNWLNGNDRSNSAAARAAARAAADAADAAARAAADAAADAADAAARAAADAADAAATMHTIDLKLLAQKAITN